MRKEIIVMYYSDSCKFCPGLRDCGDEPKPHVWHTDCNEIRWHQNGRDAERWFGTVCVCCVNCGAKAERAVIADCPTPDDRDNYIYSKEKFNSGELPLLYEVFRIINLRDGIRYLPDKYIPDYCEKSNELLHSHKWHTDDDDVNYYSEPSGTEVQVTGYCKLCGATCSELIILKTNDQKKIDDCVREYSKDKFNGGEYSVRAFESSIRKKV